MTQRPFSSCSLSITLAMLCILTFCLVSASGSEKHAPPDISGELVFNLTEIIEQVRNTNRNLLQNSLLVQNNQYTLQNAESDFDWKIRPVANLGLSKSENSTEQASGIGGKISKKNSLGMETVLSPSVAYANDGGVSSGVGVSLSIPLFRGFGKEYNYDSIYAANFALRSSVRNVYLAEVEAIVEAVSLAYEIVRQQTLVDLYQKQEERIQKHVVTIQIKENSGLGSQLDTYRAQIRLKDVQNQLAVSRQQYQATVDRLKVLLALPIDTRLTVDIPLSYEPATISIDEAEQIALANRLEIKQAEAELMEARRKAKVAEKRILPDLSFVASYRKNTFLEGLDAAESYYGDYWSVGLTSDTDIARSSEKAIYQQSLITVRRVTLNQKNQQDSIRAEVRKQLAALEKDAQSIRLREEQIVQAKGKSRLAEIKFSHGMGGNFEFIEAETELQRAKADLLSGKTAYIVGQYRLRAALGTLIRQ